MGQRKRLSKAVSGTLLGIGVSLLLLLLSHREVLEDWVNYVPPAPSARVAQLAEATTLTPDAQRLFYRQNPTVEPRDRILEQCEVLEGELVLGCYIQESQGSRIVRSKIFIQQVDDPQLQGTTEVIAAHELLHAVYSRLSSHQQFALRGQLEQAAQRVTNPRLLKILETYRKDFSLDTYYNELHSYLGTELQYLGAPELEKHYQRYFRDRQQIVALAERSSRVITELEQQADTLKAEIEQLEAALSQEQQQIQQTEAQIEESSQRLDRRQAQLQQDQAALESNLRQNKPVARQDIRNFEQAAQAFNQQVDDHNAQVKGQSDRISQYNQKVGVYQAKVAQYNQVAQEGLKILESLQGPLPTPEKGTRETLP